ncbi:MAG: hypothetical protein ACYC69_02875 [Thermodesulfovibrionales bacterium]
MKEDDKAGEHSPVGKHPWTGEGCEPPKSARPPEPVSNGFIDVTTEEDYVTSAGINTPESTPNNMLSRIAVLKSARVHELIKRELYSTLWFGCAVFLLSKVFGATVFGVTDTGGIGIDVIIAVISITVIMALTIKETDVYVLFDYFKNGVKKGGRK